MISTGWTARWYYLHSTRMRNAHQGYKLIWIRFTPTSIKYYPCSHLVLLQTCHYQGHTSLQSSKIWTLGAIHSFRTVPKHRLESETKHTRSCPTPRTKTMHKQWGLKTTKVREHGLQSWRCCSIQWIQARSQERKTGLPNSTTNNITRIISITIIIPSVRGKIANLS